MISSSTKSDVTLPNDHFHCSIDDEDLLDNIKPDLISYTLSNSYSSQLSSEINTFSGVASSVLFDKSEDSPENGDLASLVDSITLVEDHTKTFLNKRTNDSKSDSEQSFTYIESSSLKNFLQNIEVVDDIHLNTNHNLASAVPISLKDRKEMPTSSGHMNNKHTFITNGRLSSSLQDLSALPCFPLKSKSHIPLGTIQSQSMMTVTSVPKLEDSGFTRSLSCLSLNSGGKMYNHVQSKVKEYIKHIKEESSINRKENNAESSMDQELENKISDSDNQGCDSCQEIIFKMKQQLVDKDNMLLETQKMYNSLLIKHAEAENKIDRLRFKIIDPSIPELRSKVVKSDFCLANSSPTIHNKTFDLVAQSSNSSKAQNAESTVCLQTQISSGKSLTNTSTWGDIEAGSHFEQVQENTHELRNEGILAVEENATHESVASTDMMYSDKHINDRQTVHNTESQNVHEINCEVPKMQNNCNTTTRTMAQSLTIDNCSTSKKSNIDVNIVNMPTSNSLESSQPERISDCELQVKNTLSKGQIPFTKAENLKILLADKSFVETNPFRINGSSVLNEDSFLKVKRWQDSLPPLEMIEPSCYGSLVGNASGSKTSSQYYSMGPQVKRHKQVCPSGGDSGYPYSEPCQFTNKVKTSNSYKVDDEQDKQVQLVVTSDGQFKDVEHKETVLQSTSEPSSPCREDLLVGLVRRKKFASDSCLLMESLPFIQADTALCDREAVKAWEPFDCLERVDMSEKTGGKTLGNTLFEKKVDTTNCLPINVCECWGGEILPNNAHISDHVTSYSIQDKIENLSNDYFVPSLKLDDLSGNSATFPNLKSNSDDEALIAQSNSNCFKRCECCDYCCSSHEMTYTPSTSISSSAIYSLQSEKHKQYEEMMCIHNYDKMKIHPIQNSCSRFNMELLNMPGNNKFDISKNNSRKNCYDKYFSLISIDTPTSYKAIQQHKATGTRNKLLSKCVSAKTDKNNDLKEGEIMFHKVIASNSICSTTSTLKSSLASKFKQTSTTTCKESEVFKRKLLGKHTKNILLNLVQSVDTKSKHKCDYINKPSKSVHEHVNCTEKDNNISQDKNPMVVQCMPIYQNSHNKEENSNQNAYNCNPTQLLSKLELIADEHGKTRDPGPILSSQNSFLKSATSQSPERRKLAKMDLMECLDEIDFCAHRIKVHSDSIISYLSDQLSNTSTSRKILK